MEQPGFSPRDDNDDSSDITLDDDEPARHPRPGFKAKWQMTPWAGLDFPFSTHWPCLQGEPDFLMKTLGDIGYWQMLVVLLMMMFNVPVVFHVASPEESILHDFWCKVPSHRMTVAQWRQVSTVYNYNFKGETVTDPCLIKDLPYSTMMVEELYQIKTNKTKPCLKWDFNHTRVSVRSQFSLACTSLPVNNLAELMFSVGAALGSLMSAYLADKFGRRKLLMTTQIVNVLIGFSLANSTTYNGYLTNRALLGFSCIGVLQCSFVICLEITGGKWRDTFSTVYMCSYSLGYILLNLLSRLFSHWMHFQYSITLIAIFLLSIWWLVPESPRYYLTAQKLPGLMLVLETARDFNRKELLPTTLSQIKEMTPMRAKYKSPNVLMLFRGNAMARLSTVIPFISFFTSVTYFGLVLNNDLLSLSLLYSGLIEFAACMFVLLIGMKNDVLTVMVANALSGLCCLAGAFFMHNGTYLSIACMASRFFGGMMNTSLTTIIATMYPTIIRTMGLGWNNFFAHIGAAVAANIVLLSEVSNYLPLILLGMSGLLGSFAMLFLPGRVSRDLLDLIPEVEYGHEEMSRMRREEPKATPVPPVWNPPIEDRLETEAKSIAEISRSRLPFQL